MNMDNNDMCSKGIESYWLNYKRAQEWRCSNDKFRLESKLRALQTENALLHNFITHELHQFADSADKLGDQGHFDRPCLPSFTRSDHGTDEDDLGTEISDELLAFYEQTVRHQLQHRKNLEKEKQEQADNNLLSTDDLCSTLPLHLNHRSQDMDLLYGDAAAKISSMELSMQINFDSNRMKSNVPMWPNIPLRL